MVFLVSTFWKWRSPLSDFIFGGGQFDQVEDVWAVGREPSLVSALGELGVTCLLAKSSIACAHVTNSHLGALERAGTGLRIAC